MRLARTDKCPEKGRLIPSLAPAQKPGLPIRQGSSVDLEDIYNLNTSSFPEAWSRRGLADALDMGLDFQTLRNRDERLVAYYLGQDVADEVHILQLAVVKPFRCHGIGGQIIRQILSGKSCAGMRKALLEVRASNLPARHMYAKLGFSITGRRKGYYRAGSDRQREDALLMARELDTFLTAT